MGLLGRILYLGRDWNFDGAESQLFYLTGGLDKSQFDSVVLLDRAGPLTQKLIMHGRPVYHQRFSPWRSFPKAIFRYSDAWKALALAQRHNIDLVHASDLWRAPYALFISRRLRVPCVIHVRGPVLPHDIAKHRLAAADAIISIADRYRNDLINAGIPSNQISVIDDSVDLDRFNPTVTPADIPCPETFTLSANTVLVGVLGRVEPFKRILEFISVIAALPREVQAKAFYLIIGQPGPADYMREVQRAIDRHGLASRVILTGRSGDSAAILARLNILVTMSGGSIMFEAMAMSRAVLSIRPDGRHSVHTRDRETAICVTATSAAPAGQALAELIDNDTLRWQLGRAGRIWAQRHLSIDQMCRKTERLYAALLNPSTTDTDMVVSSGAASQQKMNNQG